MFNDTIDAVATSTREEIRSSTKNVTILFTDIVDSTKYWDKFGDVQGRLMVDRHNRRLFPVIAKFKGRIIKTIGDSIMAAFAKPEQAVEAAIAMQQTMALERQGDESFRIYIRVGIHTGDAIVEKEDVYGDIVNVAARVESVGKGNEILVSQTAVAYIEDEYAFIFKRKGWFVPKGKNTKLHVFTCNWQNHPLLIDQCSKSSSLMIPRNQKVKFGFYLAASAGVLYCIYLNYIRFLVSDSGKNALLYLNFDTILKNFPYLAGCAALIILILLITFICKKQFPLTLLRLIKGGFVFSVGFMIMYLLAHYLPLNKESKWNEVLSSSEHQYVKVLENNSVVFAEPSLEGKKVVQLPARYRLLQTDFRQTGDLAWNKVLVGAQQSGWIVQISPPQMGVPEKRISQAEKFYFRYKDLYVFIAGFLCFIIGFWRYRIKPI
jgi:class 3 adenylate cyclase